MSLMPVRRCRIIAVLLMGYLSFIVPVAAGEDDGQLRMITDVKETGLLALLRLELEQNWTVSATRSAREDNLPLYRLRFYQRLKGNNLRLAFEYDTVNSFHSAYPSLDRGRLLTTWTSGSAHRLVVFSLSGDSVTEVLSEGWKGNPEFVDLDSDGELEIVIPEDWLPGSWGRL
jgi:hypothetical protein